MSDTASHTIAEIMEECQHWYSETVSRLFFEDEGAPAAINLPQAYSEWADDPRTKESLPQSLMSSVRASAEAVTASFSAAFKTTPRSKADFKSAAQAFEDFVARLNRIENDSLLAGHGFDSLTGFRSRSVLIPELKRELERRARRGNPFSIAMLRIDSVASEEERDFKLKTISRALRQCIRSFDDVYLMGGVDLLVGLKHSDIKGGMRFVERLKVELKNLQASFTFSSCIAEPDPADDLDQFLKNLEKDLTFVAANGNGQSVKYEELSPLQRFVSSMKDKPQ